jgi:aromatic ring-opening dioxygenase catalytic subunit (LigB family)
MLMVSAHWEEAQPTLSAAPTHSLLYDYSGFPPHTYQLRYDAPGSPDLAQRTQTLLDGAGMTAHLDTTRGLDHGVFVPLMVMRPAADIPVIALSLLRGLDPTAHLSLGAALTPLRDEGVLIVGSGLSFHDLRAFFRPNAASRQAAEAFDDWLVGTVTDPDAERRNSALRAWQAAPGARACHPREEHLLPLMVAAGAAGTDQGQHDLSDRVFGLAHSGFRFG